MFILSTSACMDSSVLATILFIKKLTKILSIIVPAILILLLSIDFAKAVIASDDEQIKKAQHLALKRLIYGAVIFFIPMIVNVVFGLVDSTKDIKKQCYANATNEIVTSLREAESANKTVSDEDRTQIIENIKKKLAEEKEKANKKRNEDSGDTGSVEVCKDCKTGKKLSQVAEKLAWPKGTDKKKTAYPNGYPTANYKAAINRNFKLKVFWSDASRRGASCDVFIGTVVRESGYDSKFPAGLKSQIKHMEKSNKWAKINWNGSESSLKPGDILYSKHNRSNSLNNGHIYMYIGDGRLAQASAKTYFGKITNYTDRRKLSKVRYVNVYRATK